MKRKLVILIVVLISGFCSSGGAAELDLEAMEWRLIHKDAKGNLLSVAPVSVEKSGEADIMVWAKFETGAGNSPSPMLFLNELDCSQGLIRRLEVRLYNPTCSADDAPVQRMSFEGGWDRPAAGIEERLQEVMCRDEADRRM